jgi:DNA polymerase-1
LDAFAIIYRAHFAFSKSPRLTSKGLDTGAVLGFANTLFDVIKKEKPSHLAVAFDSKSPTFRHEEFEQYKAHRQEQPEAITTAVPIVWQMLEAMQIPIITLEGYEADDLVGTLAKHAPKDEFDVFMVTIDKDYAQLVDEHIFLYKLPYAGKKDTEIWGVKEVCERWEIENPDQVRDVLGLQGDASDNIPGIPGIGEKTAISLLKEYKTVENLVANADKLKGKQKENVEKFAEQALLSKKLVTIEINAPIEFHEENLRLENFATPKLKAIFEELEFKTLSKRIFGEEKPVAVSVQNDLFGASVALPSERQKPQEKPETDNEEIPLVSPKKNLYNTHHRYHLIENEADINDLIALLSEQEHFCFDTETTDLNALDAELVGIAFAIVPHEAYFVIFPPEKSAARELALCFKPLFENPEIGKIGQNLKYDYMILQNYGLDLQGKLFDTMLAHYLIEPDSRHGMDELAAKYLQYETVSIEELIGKKGKNQGNMRDVEKNLLSDYACEDADITLQLFLIFEKIIKERKHEKLFEEIEMPLMKILAKMEADGVRIDTEALKANSIVLESEIKAREKTIYEHAGEIFNIASPKQLGEILFEKMKLDPNAKRTSKSKQYATGEEILSKLESKHPIVAEILDYRELQKLKSTYVDALPLLISPKDGLIHTSYNQAVAATGRLSSTNPNLQNIPIRTERGREIRRAFVPRSSDYTLLSADYSQIELRIMAAFSKDESMITAFREGRDIHSATAAKIFKVDLPDVTSDMRRKAKTANFGIIYGISAHGLSERLRIPRAEAGEIIRAYFEEFPAVKQYMDDIINFAREHEYVETYFGRRRYIRDINSRNASQQGFAERNAINAPIQGTAADIIKAAMIRIAESFAAEGLRSKMILQVHDELVFDVLKEEKGRVAALVKEKMQNVVAWEVPLEVEYGFGDNWLEAH